MILTKDGQILTKDGQILTTDGSSGSGKEVVNLTKQDLDSCQVLSSDPTIGAYNLDFENVDFNNKYLILDFNEIIDDIQGHLQDRIDTINFYINKEPKIINSTIFIKLRNTALDDDDNSVYYNFFFGNVLFNYDVSRAYMLEMDGVSIWADNDTNVLNLYSNQTDDWDYFIKIDFDENGFAYLQVFNEYEN